MHAYLFGSALYADGALGYGEGPRYGGGSSFGVSPRYGGGSSYGGRVMDNTPSCTHQTKHSRHGAETSRHGHKAGSGPTSSKSSPLQSGVSSPTGKISSEGLLRQRTEGQRHHASSRHDKAKNQKQSAPKKAHTARAGTPRHSFTSQASRGSAPSNASQRQTRTSTVCRRKASNGGYGLFSCFGRR